MTTVAKAGPEILVNTAVAGSQVTQQITALANGGFVVTWRDTSGGIGGATGDSSDFAIKAQVFTADGDKTSSEILVNTATLHRQHLPQITALENGGFVVTWEDNSQGIGGAPGDTSLSAVKAQVFAADGARTGSEILVNTAIGGDQRDAQITGLENGGFAVTWLAGDRSLSGIKAQVFDASGDKIGSESLVNTATQQVQDNQQITALTNGGFVVTWEDNSQGVGGATGDSSATAVKAQVFTAAGDKTGSEILVNTTTLNGQFTPQITALENGSFVVTWAGQVNGDSSGSAVSAQMFAADGSKIGSEILVNTATQSFQAEPQITALADGGFVVAWEDYSAGVGGATGDNSGRAIKAQVFDATGAKTGSEILVNTATASDQAGPQITALADGNFVVTWTDQSDGVGGATGDSSSGAVKAQAFTAAGERIGSEILVNTATQGSQGQPQITALADGSFAVTWYDMSQGVGGATGDNSGSALKAQVFTLTDNPTGAAITGTAQADVIDAVFAPPGEPNPTDQADTIAGRGGDDTIHGLGGDDTIYGGAGNDTLFGNGGNDNLKGGVGDDEMHGGAGDDVYWLGDSNDAAIENAGEGTDLVRASATYTLGDNIEHLALVAGSGDIDGIGNELDNRLIGNAGANTLAGLAGNDLLLGGDGNDGLNGGRGADAMHGGTGDDIYIVDDANDAVIEDAGEGTDLVAAWLDFALGDNVENLILKGDGDINGTGNDRDNRISGNDGNNILDGGAGTDVLFGGAGDDRFVLGAPQDSPAGAERDIIKDFLVGADKIDLTAIDADVGLPGDQAFDFIGAEELSSTAGELQAKAFGANTLVSGDVDGNGQPDFEILVAGHIALQGTDFLR